MAVSLGRHIFLQACRNCSRKQLFCAVSVKFSSNHTQSETIAKPLSPTPEPTKIQTAVLKNYGSLIIEDTEPPKNVGSNEVLIDVTYCALNGPDVLLTENLYTFEPNLPMILGYELTGKLTVVGEEAQKAGFNIGDKVIALNKTRFGGFAEQCTAELGDIWKIPSSIKSLDAVCLLDNYMTALIGLEHQARIEEDDIILLSIGPGGIGLAAADLATNVFRAQVIGICANEDRASIVRERGAFAAFKYSEKKLMKQLEEVAADRDIKDIFKGDTGEQFKEVLNCFTDVYKIKPPPKDLLRDDTFGVVLQHLSRKARVIVAGILSPKHKTQSESSSFTVSGISLQECRENNHELYRQAGDDVINFYEEGLISPKQSMTTGLYKISDAMQFVAEMKCSGKVIIDFKDKEAEPKMFD